MSLETIIIVVIIMVKMCRCARPWMQYTLTIDAKRQQAEGSPVESRVQIDHPSSTTNECLL